MTEPWITQLRKGLIELCVLSVLGQAETYGYDVVRRLQEVEELGISESTVYPILARLRREGHVRSRSESSALGPPRRYLNLTTLGRRRLEQMNAYWRDLTEAVRRLNSQQQREGTEHDG